MRYIDPELRAYSRFIVDPVQIRTQQTTPVLAPKERAEVVCYMRDTLRKVLGEGGFQITDPLTLALRSSALPLRMCRS